MYSHSLKKTFFGVNMLAHTPQNMSDSQNYHIPHIYSHTHFLSSCCMYSFSSSIQTSMPGSLVPVALPPPPRECRSRDHGSSSLFANEASQPSDNAVRHSFCAHSVINFRVTYLLSSIVTSPRPLQSVCVCVCVVLHFVYILLFFGFCVHTAKHLF